MNTTWIVLLIVAGVLLLACFVVGVVFLVLFLVKQFGGATGGWGKLAERYGTAKPPAGQVFTRQTVQIGAVVQNRCVTIGIAEEGVYLSIRGKTALIPWTEFQAVGQTMLHWQKVPMLTVGNPPVATMTVPVAVFQTMRQRLPASVTQS